MTSPNERALLFELRCRTRREVAEALHRLLPTARGEEARLLRGRYLAALHSAVALQEVRRSARELVGRPR